MGAIRPGGGGGGAGATALGDLTDIGTMGEPVAQSDNLAEVVTALGGAAAVRTALDVAEDRPTVTYTLPGATTDYTADAAYAPAGLTSISGGSVSARLGDGTNVPYFSALRKSEIASGGLERTATGLRLTRGSANSASGGTPWPYADTGAGLRIPLVGLPRDVQVDFKIVVNIDTNRSSGGSDMVQCFAGLTRHSDTGARAYTLGGVWIHSYFPDFSGAIVEYALGPAAPGAYLSTDSQRDISSSGEGTVANITTRDIRVILKGDIVEVLTGPGGGALTRRIYYADVAGIDSRDGTALTVTLGQDRSSPQAGYYAELRSLVITPL